MARRVLVTGAAGFIGSHLVESLLERGDEVIGIDNFDPFYSQAEKRENLARALATPSFRLIEADCSDLEAIDAALRGQQIDVIVHLAAKAGVRPSITDPTGYVNANVVGTQVMLELARRSQVERFVLASSSSVYGNNPKVPFAESDPVDNPISPYAATKRSAELLAHTYFSLYGMRILALRFFTVYGPRQRPDLAIRKFAELMRRGGKITLYGDGSTERDYTWISDIIAGVLAAIDRTESAVPVYRIINLGESATTSLRRLVSLLGDALQVVPDIRFAAPQAGDVERTFADISLARTFLGYRPTTPVEIGIPKFIEWLNSRPL